MSRWLKPLVTIALYAVVFYWTDASAIVAQLGRARLEPLMAGVLLYMAGQVVSSWKWHILLGPVRLEVPFLKVLAFYFTGMFFNLFLPTIVGGDAVKALLLARETGAPARAPLSVFMERNVGLCALLIVAIGAAELAPLVELFGLSLRTLTWLLAAGYAAANLVLMSPLVYRLVDHVIAATPLARVRQRADSLYRAIVPYRSAPGRLLAGVGLSFIFQGVVIAVVFLNARALALDVPLAAVAVFVPLVSLAGMVPVSVNGLGVREALYILLFGRIGVPVETAVSLALLYLAVTLLASLPGGLAYLMQPARTPELTSEPTATDS